MAFKRTEDRQDWSTPQWTAFSSWVHFLLRPVKAESSKHWGTLQTPFGADLQSTSGTSAAVHHLRYITAH